MNLRYLIELEPEEREQLTALVQSGRRRARQVLRANILLMADRRRFIDKDIVDALSTSTSTVYRVKQQFVEEGLEAALNDQRRPGAQRKLTAAQEAGLVALACSTAPKGRKRWTLRLLADQLVALCEDLDNVSHETVRKRLAEKKLKPWLKKMWCIRKVDAAFIAQMEDILDLYAEEPDPDRPVVCFDEAMKQLVAHVRAPLPVIPGEPAKEDGHYKRNGTAKLHVFIDAHRRWRQVLVTETRKAVDFAVAMKKLVDEFYPDADKIRVVLDNLNIHRPASLYVAFPPAEARRILKRLEFHFTPTHASWLNMAEIEIGSLTTQCLDRRIPDMETLDDEVTAWVDSRNDEGATINWMFDVVAARQKMARHYPEPMCNPSEPA